MNILPTQLYVATCTLLTLYCQVTDYSLKLVTVNIVIRNDVSV